MRFSLSRKLQENEMERAKIFHFIPTHFLLLLVIVLVFSPYAVSQSVVRNLPGFDGPLPFYLETGYVSVDESNDGHLFYYFVKSENNPLVDPLMLWLTGGPGCTVFTAFAFEIGPLHFKGDEYNGDIPTLVLNPNSWTKVSNILFVDAPVGTGFSYPNSLEYPLMTDTKAASQLYTFLRKWLTSHPEFLTNPLYIGGDSYSGIVVPVLVQDISNGNIDGNETFLNLKGYVLGNPVTDRDQQNNYYVPFLHGMAIISDELFESAKKNCGGYYVNKETGNKKCKKDLQEVSKCTKGLCINNVLETECPEEIPMPPQIQGLKCRAYAYVLSYYWANNDTVRQSLNIQKGTVPEWKRCHYLSLNYLGDVKSTIHYHLEHSKRNYRSLIYSGDHDIVVPFLSTQAWIRSLNYSISDEWRPWFVNGQVAGYTRSYTNNMTFATVKGGGHTAPEYYPEECAAMFKRWVSYEPL